jgi:hypothetical protein
MKASGRRWLWLLVLVFAINGCASKTEVASESTTPSAATVPGEKISGEPGVAPGPGGANASVRW